MVTGDQMIWVSDNQYADQIEVKKCAWKVTLRFVVRSKTRSIMNMLGFKYWRENCDDSTQLIRVVLLQESYRMILRRV